MATTLRCPFAFDAYQEGFLTGYRKDDSYQLQNRHTNVNLDYGFLNNFYDPDIDGYLDTFQTHDPSVAVIGDA